eukprot:1158085-Pelagomonas_calceolata.AAC.8
MASRFGLVRRKEGGENNPQGASDAPLTASEETRAKVEAAKAKIENMYKVQNQNIQERLSRRQALEAQLVQEGMSLEDRQTVLAELERRESDYTRLQVFAGGQQQNYADVWVMRMPACYASLNPLSYVKDKPVIHSFSQSVISCILLL